MLSLAGLGCPFAPKVVVYDLARRVEVAERWSSRDVLLFGTAGAEPYEADGFYREAARAPGDGFVWSRREAELSLTWPAVQPRAAVVELAPFRGVRGQAVEVSLNGVPLGRFALADDRHRYPLSLPVAAQRPGDNRLRFVFAGTAAPADDPAAAAANPDRRQLAAAFYSLVVGPADDPGLLGLLARDAPHPFAVTEAAGVPTLVQWAPSVVRFAVRLPPSGELRFTPDLHPLARAAAGAASLRVTVETRAGEERSVWARVVRGRDVRRREEVRVALPGRAGDIVRIGLHVGTAGSGPGADRFTWATWTAPRVLGRSGSDGLDLIDTVQAAAPRPEDDRAGELRRSLQGLNAMLIILDAARARELGCYGYARPTTPEIDRIAADGVVFDGAFTPAVYTLAAMSSVWTSQYPDRHHAEVSYADRLPTDRLTLAEVLSGHGVVSAGFVANPMAGRAFGFDRGFGEFHEVFTLFPELGSRAGSFRRVLPGWLAKARDRRFFAYLHVREPHFPYDPPAPFDTRFGPNAPLTAEQRRDRTWYTAVNQGTVRPTAEELAHLVRLYDGNLAYADQEVGAMRQALEAAGLWDRTVVVIAADHGEQLGEHGYISHSAQVYDDSMHIPLIVRFPSGRGPRGVRVSALVDLLDLAPTLLDVLGFGADKTVPRVFQGRSLLPVMAGAPGKAAVLSRTVWDRPVYALRDARYKLVYDTRSGRQQLFDLTHDPGERQERQAEDPLRAAYYRQTLQHWIGTLARSPRGGAAGGPASAMTPEQCDNLRSLGYVVAECR